MPCYVVLCRAILRIVFIYNDRILVNSSCVIVSNMLYLLQAKGKTHTSNSFRRQTMYGPSRAQRGSFHGCIWIIARCYYIRQYSPWQFYSEVIKNVFVWVVLFVNTTKGRFFYAHRDSEATTGKNEGNVRRSAGAVQRIPARLQATQPGQGSDVATKIHYPQGCAVDRTSGR